MDNQLLQIFIERYYLNGLNNKAKITTSEHNTIARVMTENKSLVSKVLYKNSDMFPDGEIGIFDTDQLLKLLGLYDNTDEKFSVEFDVRDDTPYAILMSGSNNVSSKYMLADPEVIEDSPEIRQIDTWDVEFTMTEQEVKTFTKARSALSNAKLLFVEKNDIFMGNNEYGTNKVTLTIQDYSADSLSGHIKFDLDNFKEVVSVLKKDIKVQVMNDGLMRVFLEDDHFHCEYYLSSIVSD